MEVVSDVCWRMVITFSWIDISILGNAVESLSVETHVRFDQAGYLSSRVWNAGDFLSGSLLLHETSENEKKTGKPMNGIVFLTAGLFLLDIYHER
jgi:hypothetical protein